MFKIHTGICIYVICLKYIFQGKFYYFFIFTGSPCVMTSNCYDSATVRSCNGANKWYLWWVLIVPANSHVITICDIPYRLPTSSVNGEANRKTEVTVKYLLSDSCCHHLMMATRTVKIVVAKWCDIVRWFRALWPFYLVVAILVTITVVSQELHI